MDDIENTINEADKCIAAWDWEISVSGQTLATAYELEMALTKMKLAVGVERFDELPAYARKLREASEFIDSHTKKEDIK